MFLVPYDGSKRTIFITMAIYSPISNCRGGQLPIFWFFGPIFENLNQNKVNLANVRSKTSLLVLQSHIDRRFETPSTPSLVSRLEIIFQGTHFFHPLPFIRPLPTIRDGRVVAYLAYPKRFWLHFQPVAQRQLHLLGLTISSWMVWSCRWIIQGVVIV